MEIYCKRLEVSRVNSNCKQKHVILPFTWSDLESILQLWSTPQVTVPFSVSKGNGSSVKIYNCSGQRLTQVLWPILIVSMVRSSNKVMWTYKLLVIGLLKWWTSSLISADHSKLMGVTWGWLLNVILRQSGVLWTNSTPIWRCERLMIHDILPQRAICTTPPIPFVNLSCNATVRHMQNGWDEIVTRWKNCWKSDGRARNPNVVCFIILSYIAWNGE